jgi:hypothetical protein
MINKNKQGEIMKVVEYNSSSDLIIEFQDEWKERKHVIWSDFCNGSISNPHKKKLVGIEKYNNQGSLMKIVAYNSYNDMTVEFQDKYKFQKNTNFDKWKKGKIKNPYFPSVYGVGIIGSKYPACVNYYRVKEYVIWIQIINRCFEPKTKEKNPTYQDVTCCEEWLLYENFYEWLHSQENFDKWLNGERWSIDKDILVKGNKIYSPETCCLVPGYVNSLFVKKDANRGKFPIGVSYSKKEQRYKAIVSMGVLYNNKKYDRSCGLYPTPEDAFYLGYKPTKERYIQRVAQEEFDKGNITKRCYEAMMNYEVEITD